MQFYHRDAFPNGRRHLNEPKAATAAHVCNSRTFFLLLISVCGLECAFLFAQITLRARNSISGPSSPSTRMRVIISVCSKLHAAAPLTVALKQGRSKSKSASNLTGTASSWRWAPKASSQSGNYAVYSDVNIVPHVLREPVNVVDAQP